LVEIFQPKAECFRGIGRRDEVMQVNTGSNKLNKLK